MRLSRLLFALLLLGLAGVTPARAQDTGSSPYTVTLPVTDTGEAQRDQTFASALSQVLARVAGGQDLRSKSGYGDALANASGMVKQYQYQRGSDGIELQVSFDRGAVNHLITQLGVPAAGAKPPVLLLVAGADGHLLGKDSLGALAQSAAAQGYTVIYPGATPLPPLDRVAAADPAALAQLTATYNTGLVLLGHLHQRTVDWTLISGGVAQSWGGTGASEDDLMTAAGAALAARIGKQLNVIGSGANAGRLWITGVDSAIDYAQMINALRSDPAIRGVSTLGAKDDGILLKVSSALPFAALASNLAAGGRLLQAPAHDGADASLRWLH